MTQPEYVPITTGDRVRGAERLPVPVGWAADRPAETSKALLPAGPRLGTVGPDQGYALRLARQFGDRLELTSVEDKHDAVAGCVAIATKRAATFGRAPTVYDVEHAFTLWGYLGGAPQEIIDIRVPAFQGAAHDYWLVRAIVDQVPEETLRLSPAEVRERLPVWRTLFG